MPPTAAHLSGISAAAQAGPTGPLRTAAVSAVATQHNNHRWAEQLMGGGGGQPGHGGSLHGVSLQPVGGGQQSSGGGGKPDIITIYRAASAADRSMAGRASHDDASGDSTEDEMEDEEAMSLNGDDSSSGGSGAGHGGLSLAPPPPVTVTVQATPPHYSNPAASLVPSCPCGCKEDEPKQAAGPLSTSPSHVYPESPASSPIKSRYPSTSSGSSAAAAAADGPLDMSKVLQYVPLTSTYELTKSVNQLRPQI